MIGKKLISAWKGVLHDPKQLKVEAKKIKTKLLESKGQKRLVITAICINGVIMVIKGYDKICAIAATSYKDIDKNNLADTKVLVVQYPKMSQNNIKLLLSV